MDKEKFLSELKEKLSNLSAEERDSIIADYEKKFDAAKMQSEKSVIDEIGTMDKITEDILKSKNDSAVINNVQEGNNESKREESNNKNNSLSFVSLILIAIFIVILIPVIIPLFFAVCGILIGFFFAGVGISIAGVAVSGAGLVGLFIQPINGLLMIGVGCILFALGLLLTVCSVYISAICFPMLIRGIVKFCRVPFQKGE